MGPHRTCRVCHQDTKRRFRQTPHGRAAKADEAAKYYVSAAGILRFARYELRMAHQRKADLAQED